MSLEVPPAAQSLVGFIWRLERQAHVAVAEFLQRDCLVGGVAKSAAAILADGCSWWARLGY